MQGKGNGLLVALAYIVPLGAVEDLFEGDKGVVLAYLVLFPDALGHAVCASALQDPTIATQTLVGCSRNIALIFQLQQD